ncbi:MAG: sulfatase-like hydrolase/transferase [Oscillospiraceae bacterium]|nr:sulfatase-like hydrolase/transferase [Oscillospiraceae bacterium]
MNFSHRPGEHSEGRLLWSRWRRLAAPSLFFLGVIYYEELFLKLYCFHGLSLAGAVFTFLFSIPIAMLLGALCSGVRDRFGQRLLVLCTALISLWMGAQTVYYHLFKTFLTIFSLTKMMMVAGAFGNMALGEILLNWFPILMMAVPVVLAAVLRKRLLPDHPMGRRCNLRWLALGLGVQLAGIVLVLFCGGGVLSLRYIYFQAAVPELEVQNFGMFTQTELEIRRVLFGIDPDDQILPKHQGRQTRRWIQPTPPLIDEEPNLHVMDIDFQALMERDQDDPALSEMHSYFSKVKPTEENEWTGRFRGKNLIWIVAEGFSDQLLDPVRTPTLWKLSHEGIICDNFYTPLWGVSTSDGEYVTTTGLIPKSGVWSYSESSDNAMPFAFGHQFQALGYRTMAFHDYLYTYYDRNLSHPNMGYEYYGIGNGLELEEVFPPSDLEMMEKIVPWFINEDQFMVYCLTVSGHLNYNREENVMSDRHYDEVADLPYSEGVKCYLACQQELELAMESLVRQLEEAGKLEDTVIVLSADHYPYGLTDEEYSELFGHPVDPVFEIYENSLILWSADLEEPVHVDKYCSSLDVMPTLANLFGLEYDSRLMAGRDILSSAPGLVIFSNYSFLTDLGAYNSTTDLFEMWDGSKPDPDYVAERVAEVQNRVAYSASILDNDYYRVVFGDPEG